MSATSEKVLSRAREYYAKHRDRLRASATARARLNSDAMVAKKAAKRAEWKAECQRRGQTFHGRPCRSCTGTERFVNSRNCVFCVRRGSAKFRERHPDRHKQYRAQHGYRYNLNRRLKKYGLTQEQFSERLESQGSCCAICKTRDPGGRGWQIDHDHVTGVARGILCVPCNTVLGLTHEDASRLLAAMEYLEKWAPRP